MGVGELHDQRGGRFVASDRQTLVAYNALPRTCVPCFMQMNVRCMSALFTISLLEQRQEKKNFKRLEVGGRGFARGGGDDGYAGRS